MASVPNSGPSAPPPPVWDARPPEAQVHYAGFWLRTVAALIDGIILMVAIQVMGFFLVAPVDPPADMEDLAKVLDYVNAAMPIQQIILSTVLIWAYYAFQESSAAQATLGKRALGIRVSATDGTRLDLAKASLRAWPIFLPNAAWLVSSGLAMLVGLVALVACLTVAFSSRKQGIHDMMAGAVLTKS
ncbi:MAG: RDD family protein [Reyranella sp.]|nr:RDD family protein [Reyranella sp.]